MTQATIKKAAMKDDHAIHQAVLQELIWDMQVEETEVGVEVDQGVVTLTGTVRSYAKKMAAQEAAHRVTGVLDVANDIQVSVPGTTGMKNRRFWEPQAMLPVCIKSRINSVWIPTFEVNSSDGQSCQPPRPHIGNPMDCGGST
jgi:hypothetical protein